MPAPTSQSKEIVLIIGGAIIGTMCAYFLRREGFSGRIIVLEKDPSYQFSSTALSAAGIRTQFGCPFSVEMGLFGAQFVKSLPGLYGSQADVGFRESGYLLLGSRETEATRLKAMEMQNSHGASILPLDAADASCRFPWLNTADLGVATLGLKNEGWLDAWGLMSCIKSNCKKSAVEYITAEALALVPVGNKIARVETDNDNHYDVDWVIVAAGANSAQVVSSLGIELPVEPRKRTVFVISAPLSADNFPMIFDTSGAWIRPEGEGFICGIAPEASNDPNATGDFEPDYDLFEERVWPALAHRIPALEQLRMQRAWAGHYEMNTLDNNGIVGPHTQYRNLLFATGFSGHGIMHSPAVGRGIAELITLGQFQSIDMSALGYGRIESMSAIRETIVY